ncbi:MAG: YfhO family protein [Deltaproteobacteria bacterium]|nr:YfhO family protein [Deltaproteobacteria bacterium]
MGYFLPVLDGAHLLTERDLGVFFIPPRILWTDIIRAGEFPLWNPYFYGGHPLLASLQPGALYPLNWPLIFLPFDITFNWILTLHFALAGIFAFLLLRELRASVIGSLIGALTFMLSGYLFSAHNVMSTLFSVVWAPLVVFFFLRTIRGSSFGYASLTGFSLTMMFLGGGIETIFATIGLLFFLALIPGILLINDDVKQTLPSAPRRLALFLAAIVVFALLSAAQLLPFLELVFQSTRSQGLTFFEASTWSFAFKDFVQFFIPDPFGYGVSDAKYWANQSWLKTVYTGSIPFIFALFFAREYKAKAAPFLIAMLFSIILAMGNNTPLYYYLYSYVPVFNKIRYPVKFLFITFLFVSVAAGIGFDAFVKGIDHKEKTVGRIALALLVMSVAAAFSLGALDYFESWAWVLLKERGIEHPAYNHIEINIFNTKRALVFFILASIAVYAAFRSLRFKRIFPYAVLLLLSVDLFFAHEGYYFTSVASEYHKKSRVMEFLETDKSLYRVFVTPKTLNEAMVIKNNGEFDEEFLDNMNIDKERLRGYNLEHRVFNADGFDVIRRHDYDALYGALIQQTAPDATNMLAMLNVKYMVSMPMIESKEFRLKKIIGLKKGVRQSKELERMGTIKVYENLNYLPRFFVADSYSVVPDNEQCLKRVSAKTFLPSKEALLFEEPWPDGRREERRSQTASVNVAAYANNSVDLEVNMLERGVLVASESWYPGWMVYVDGEERKVLKADCGLRGVAVDKGAHVVRFAYRPAFFIVGAFVSSLTGIGLSALLITRRKGKGRE